jgi:hypothetical protein
MDWIPLETSNHQDHVIAHVVGATPLGYFIFDETAYFLLDIGFIWNIYLDGEMGLLPHPVATAELAVDDSIKAKVKQDVDAILQASGSKLQVLSAIADASPIEKAELLTRERSRRLVLTCERGSVVVETSLESGEVKIEDY